MLKDLSRLRVLLARGPRVATGAKWSASVEVGNAGAVAWLTSRLALVPLAGGSAEQSQRRMFASKGGWFSECSAPEQPRYNAGVSKLVFSNCSYKYLKRLCI